jgi:hypothetical protein
VNLKKLRQRFERFCLRNQTKGIPNLMLYICLGSGVVTFVSMINGGYFLYDLLCFDKAAILQGQVWRLFSWLLTEQLGGGLLSVLFLYFFYRLGNAVERSIGTFKFNLFYLVGVVMMDVFAMVFCPTDNVIIGNMLVPPEAFTAFYGNMAYYLHLSMVLAFATMYPDSQFMIFFILPVKAWVIALVDLVMIGISVLNMCYPILFFPHCLFPLIGLLNYFLFFGPDMGNLLPLTWRVKLQRRKNKSAAPHSSGPRVVQFTPPQRQEAKPNYTHRCTVCGRTDVSNPELEFRYCSRCSGYHCYCQEHISNHTHVE